MRYGQGILGYARDRRTGTRGLCVAAAIFVLLTAAAPPSAALEAAGSAGVESAAEPQTADGLLDALRSHEGEPALEAYGELEVVRSQAVTAVQAGELTDAERRQTTHVLTVIESFGRAYELANDGDYAESLEAANETADAVERLREAGGRRYADFAQIALERFYERQGDRLFERAQNTAATPTRLSLLSEAATAYKRAGASERFSELAVRESNLRSTFESDMEKLAAATDSASAFLTDCGACASPAAAIRTAEVGVFSKYAEAREVHRTASRAAQFAREHSVDERIERAESLAARSEGALQSFAVASAALSLGYGALVGLVGALLGYRVALWGRDVRDARVGEIVASVTRWDDA